MSGRFSTSCGGGGAAAAGPAGPGAGGISRSLAPVHAARERRDRRRTARVDGVPPGLQTTWLGVNPATEPIHAPELGVYAASAVPFVPALVKGVDTHDAGGRREPQSVGKSSSTRAKPAEAAARGWFDRVAGRHSECLFSRAEFRYPDHFPRAGILSRTWQPYRKAECL